MAGDGTSLQVTPTWAVAIVCTGLIMIALLIEHGLHLLTKFIRKRKRKALNQALSQINAELRKLGFISLLMTMAGQPISKICISKTLGDTFLPCSKDAAADEDLGSCASKGKEPLLSGKGMAQLQVLVFVLAVFHVLSSLLTLFLGEAKIKRWQNWEEETQTLDYQLSHDPRKVKLARQTSYGKRHMKWWSNNNFLVWQVCFLRQFVDSVSKADYFALRHGFISGHLSRDCQFDFHKFLTRSLDQDFVMVVKISASNWIYITLFIFFNSQGFVSYYWLPFIPLVILLIMGMKLESIITMMCIKSNKESNIVPGGINVKLGNDFFWFRNPQLILHLIHFVLVQNSFQLAFLAWTWILFSSQRCGHCPTSCCQPSGPNHVCLRYTTTIYVGFTDGSIDETDRFTENVVNGLENWHRMAKKNLSLKKTTLSSPSPSSLSHRGSLSMPSAAHYHRTHEFKYPSDRRELEEIQKVAEELIQCNMNNVHHEGEISFRLWRKQGVELPRRP